MQAILAQILAALTDVASLTSDTSVIGKIISMLEGIFPLLSAEYNALKPAVQGIIAALTANTATTADQLTALKTLDDSTDAAFDAAAAAAEAEDAGST